MDVTYLTLRTLLVRRPISTVSTIFLLFLYSTIRKAIANRELEVACYFLLLLLFPKRKHKYHHHVALKARMSLFSPGVDACQECSQSVKVDPDELIASLRENPVKHRHFPHHGADSSTSHNVYGSRYHADVAIPKFRMPDKGGNTQSIYQIIKDELDLDGKPNLNLASFVNTFMDPYADKLMAENMSKNLADADEYPIVQAIHSRCISMLGNLWNVPKGETAVGTATTGSSEAIHLGGLAFKRLWQQKRRAEGKSTEKPNIIMGANAQVALEKYVHLLTCRHLTTGPGSRGTSKYANNGPRFARYFEVEARILPVSGESHYCLNAKLIRDNVDENTIGVFVILGSTYTGHYEPVEEISEILDAYEEETGHSIPIHIDGASGAMGTPSPVPAVRWNVC